MDFRNRISDIDRIKGDIDACRPLSPHALKQIREYFRIGLTYSSNALEGNSLTETETKIVLEEGLTVGGKPLREHFEAIGHSDAYDFMQLLARKEGVEEQDILELHRLFYYRIDQSNAGSYRKVAVVVTGTDYAFPAVDRIEGLMQEFLKDASELRVSCHPIEYAALVHARLVTIHPFIDGNGRTARLLMNALLLQCGYGVTIIPPLMRSYYIASVRQANKGIEHPFMEFISEMIYESSKDYLRLLRQLG